MSDEAMRTDSAKFIVEDGHVRVSKQRIGLFKISHKLLDEYCDKTISDFLDTQQVTVVDKQDDDNEGVRIYKATGIVFDWVDEGCAIPFYRLEVVCNQAQWTKLGDRM